jgi:hypothetical protein
MKTARTYQGQLITASLNAPRQAICPICGGAVTLRSRELMANGGTIYYWRHKDNQVACRRPRPVMHVRYELRYLGSVTGA